MGATAIYLDTKAEPGCQCLRGSRKLWGERGNETGPACLGSRHQARIASYTSESRYMVLDPQVRTLLDQLVELHPPVTTLSVAQARTIREVVYERALG